MDAIIRFLQDTGFYLFSQDGNWRCLIMLGIACVLLYLGIVKKFEPLLLVPIAFGMLITNLPGANMFHEIFFAGGHIHWDLIGGQPATESLVATLKGTVRDTGLDQSKLSEAAAHFRKVAARLQNEGILDPKVLRVDTNTLLYQVPGGMLSNLISQLKQAGKEDKYYDVLAEIPRVRKDFGYPPLVTPTSQIVGTQAVMNVIVGKYKTFPKESKGLLRGEYGALPGEVNPEVRALAGIDPEAVITCRPADNIAPELETYKEQFKDIAKSEEDVLSLALFPQVAPKFLAWRDGPHEAPAQPAEAPKAPPADPNAVRELFVEYKF